MIENAQEPAEPYRLGPIVQRLPPQATDLRRWAVGLIAGLIIATIMFALVFAASGARVPSVSFFAVGGVFILVALIIVLTRHAQRKRRKEYLSKTSAAFPPPEVERALARFLRDAVNRRRSALSDLMSATQHYFSADLDRAMLITLGIVDIPAVGVLHFEPVLITSTDIYWRRIRQMFVYLGILSIWIVPWLFRQIGVSLPVGALPRPPSYFIVVIVVTAIAWFWKAHIRPSYVRLAPGIVQIVEYSVTRQSPKLRAYPMEKGTWAVIDGSRKAETLVLARGECCDRIPLGSIRKSKYIVPRVWEALLSTAPIPPLSEEELIG